MKNFKLQGFTWILAILVMTLISALNAADTVNGDTTSYVEDDYNYYWYGKVTFAAGNATDDIWSHTFDVSDCELWEKKGTIQVWGNAASGIDVNVYVEGSNTLYDDAFEAFRTDLNLDAAGANAGKLAFIGGSDIFTGDTVVVANNGTDQEELAFDAASSCQYLRLQFDGQSGNPAGAVIYYSIKIPKRIVGRASTGNKLAATTATLPTYGKRSTLTTGRKKP